jgi:hypothetical protein
MDRMTPVTLLVSVIPTSLKWPRSPPGVPPTYTSRQNDRLFPGEIPESA